MKPGETKKLYHQKPGPEVMKLFMLNITEHEILTGY